MSSKVSCFVAYPSRPPALAETIEEAISRIKKGQVVAIDGWKSTSAGGRFVITTICEAIDRRDLFICDLTTLNHNVLFELGYAIAKKKRIWILLDPSIEKSRMEYEKFKMLTTVGYESYTNSTEIEKNFYLKEPYNDLENTIYREAIESIIAKKMAPRLLYLKSGIETEASIKLSSIITKYDKFLPIVIDDPKEVKIQALSWYAQEVNRAYAVLVHFLSSEHIEHRFHNAKNSFVSGLALGFNRKLLMLAHEPYESPIDYREMLRTHDTGERCVNTAKTWLDDIRHSYNQWVSEKRKFEEEVQARTDLQNIWIGDSIAENESDDLLGYFVPTASYVEALASKNSIFIGRRGTGKTAILYKLGSELKADKRNHICIIKPVSYELEGILNMLKLTTPKAEKGFLIESFWKFLVYTELAKSVYEELKAKPAYYETDDAERKLVTFVEQNALIITSSFSIRLEAVVEKLQALSQYKTAREYRWKISELLHENIISKLRLILGDVLKKCNKVVIIVDNLDKTWEYRQDLPILSDLLFGLLGVSNRISQDFMKSNHLRTAVNLSLIIFLRSDIFTQIRKYAHEKDKISYSKIIWDDPQLLLRVLEERFFVSSSLSKPTAVWGKYFCAKIGRLSTKNYLIKSILPRPRDLISIAKAAIAQAMNRGHTKVDKDDICEAQKKYSQQALESLVSEECTLKIEELLYEFVGMHEIIDRDDIIQAMNKCNIADEKLNDVSELLCDLTFLGMEVENDRFEFLYNDDDKAKFQVMARKTAEMRSDKKERFRIHNAFHPYLEIKPMTC